MKRLILLIFLFGYKIAFTQTDTSFRGIDSLGVDSLVVKDSTRQEDSLQLVAGSAAIKDTFKMIMGDTIFFKPVKGISELSVKKNGVEKGYAGKEYLFYYLVFLVLIVGIMNRVFNRYFENLYRLFFRTTLKQRQARDQMQQSPLPTFFLNCFFIITTGLYVSFILEYYDLSIHNNFWMQYLYCTGALAGIYLIKFGGLKFAGWLFHVKETAESYIFVVFIVNKVLGIALLPLVILLAFVGQTLFIEVLFISYFIAAVLMFYRFVLSYGVAGKEIKISPFHFFIYIGAFEVIPLLMIYKLLLIIF